MLRLVHGDLEGAVLPVSRLITKTKHDLYSTVRVLRGGISRVSCLLF